MMLQVLLKVLLACISITGAAGFTPPSHADHNARARAHQTTSSRIFATTVTPIDFSFIFDIAEEAHRNTIEMSSTWATDHGIQRADGFQLTEEDDYNNHKEVYASTTQDMPTGTPVLIIPESLILSSNKAITELRTTTDMIEAEQHVINAGAESELRHYYLILKILLEIQNGMDSQWYPWLNSLPRYFSNAASMTDYCLLCLPPLMRKLAGEERANQQRLGIDSVMMVPFLSDDIKNHEYRDLVKWAYQIVYTRAVETDDGDLKIIPLADYFNHGSDYTEIESSYDDAGNYYAYTSYDVTAGSPLRISYADPRNPSFILARYGFLDENCPATYCKLLPPTLNQDMLDLGYSTDRMLFYNNGEVADEVWDIFLYQHSTPMDQQALMRAHRAGDYDTKLVLHEKYYSATSQALLEHVDDFLADVDKLIKKAENTGVNDPNSPYIKYEHPRLPLIHRHNLFVRETFQNVRDRYSIEDNWRDSTRVTVQECDDNECAIAECVQNYDGEWECEGGLGPNWDGSERQKTQTVIAAA